MELNFNQRGNAELQRTLAKMGEQAPYIASSALNSVAYEIRARTQERLPTWVHLTRPFLRNSVIYEKATPTRLYAAVGFHKRANFAKLLEEGGTRTPKQGKALAVPIDAPRNASGGITWSNRPAQMMNKKGVFSGMVNMLGGIWKSTKRVPLRLLYVFKRSTKYNKRFLHFRQTADEVIAQEYARKFKEAILRNLSRSK